MLIFFFIIIISSWLGQLRFLRSPCPPRSNTHAKLIVAARNPVAANPHADTLTRVKTLAHHQHTYKPHTPLHLHAHTHTHTSYLRGPTHTHDTLTRTYTRTHTLAGARGNARARARGRIRRRRLGNGFHAATAALLIAPVPAKTALSPWRFEHSALTLLHAVSEKSHFHPLPPPPQSRPRNRVRRFFCFLFLFFFFVFILYIYNDLFVFK